MCTRSRALELSGRLPKVQVSRIEHRGFLEPSQVWNCAEIALKCD
ncbi:MAG: hypothetical protein QOJ04_1739 [Caballeronia sp.]|jgi:hypothetical protein|nr:hypothetical protein [Caballeronia sp.]